MMISPVVKVYRSRTAKPRSQHSIREISQSYFNREHSRSLFVEAVIFLVLAAVATLPIMNVVGVIHRYLQ